MTQNSLNGVRAIIFICDITNKETYKKLKFWLRNVKECYPKGNI